MVIPLVATVSGSGRKPSSAQSVGGFQTDGELWMKLYDASGNAPEAECEFVECALVMGRLIIFAMAKKIDRDMFAKERIG
ncbi:hypothetical protein E2P81_ATG04647 [Venturia nashicola]|nr:hypothetical protein E2P81_ATG04647 [Venturia nashicola]